MVERTKRSLMLNATTNPTIPTMPRRRYHQPAEVPPSRPGMTGKTGAALWHILIPFLSIIGASLGLGFGARDAADNQRCHRPVC